MRHPVSNPLTLTGRSVKSMGIQALFCKYDCVSWCAFGTLLFDLPSAAASFVELVLLNSSDAEQLLVIA